MSEYDHIQKEKAARKVYQTYWESYANGDLETFASTLDETYEMIGTSESEVCHTKADGINFLKGQIEEIVGKAELRNRQIEVIPVDQLMLVNEHCDIYVLADSVWNFYSKIRISTLIRETETGWKVVQQHGSLPDMRVQEGETLAIEKIKKKNIELRDAVKRRTAELENKNRKLEIEAALERVRSRSMAMHKSNELQEVISVVLNQLISLGIKTDVTYIVINAENTKDFNLWLATKNNDYARQINLPYFKHPIHDDGLKAAKKQVGLDTHSYSREEKNRYFEYQFKHSDLKYSPEERKKFILDAPGYTRTIAINKHTSIAVDNYGTTKFSKKENEILIRIAKVFEQAYTRFLDIQKAEVQAREAQIEAALERVRSRSMGMQKSEELAEVIAQINAEITNLGIRSDNTTLITDIKLNEKSGSYCTWFSIPGKTYSNKFLLPRIQHRQFEKMLEAYQKKIEFYTLSFTKEEKNRYLNFYFAESDLKYIPDERKEFLLNAPGWSQSVVLHKNSGLVLQRFNNEEFSEEENAVAIRFGHVFEQTYTRFLDLQKAEAQAREAQIEAALERVRAKAMAMHTSKDISDATAIVFNELTMLGIKMIRCGIVIFNETYIAEVWSTKLSPKDKQVIDVVTGNLNMSIHPMLENAYRNWKSKNDYFTYNLTGIEVRKYYELLAKEPGYHFPKTHKYPEHQILNNFNFNEGQIFAYSEKVLNEEEKQIFQRFTKVFSLTYRRYLDLINAERQAREAQIETALERVRSRTMAMHKSEELGETAYLLFQQMLELGVNPERFVIGILSEKEDVFNFWVTEQGGNRLNTRFTGSINEPICISKWYKAVQEKKKSSVIEISGKELASWVKYLKDELFMPLDEKLVREKRIHSSGVFSKGILIVTSPEHLPHEQVVLLERFAAVFDQTYTRFLDLQKAETQAREAQIEAALERVRAKAMSMQNSEDLNATIGAFYRELEQFSITPRRCGVGLLQKNRLAELSTMNTMEQGNSIEIIGKLKMEGHWVLDGVYDNWILQKEFHPVLRGNEIKEYNQLLRPQIAFPEYPNNLVQYGYFFFFPEGGVYAWTEKEMKEDELKIYRRFTTVLSLTYKRYKDLKDAEANAREAVRRASLDRVRAEIASMRTVDDLQRITPIIWHELTVLGVPFVRCGVFIMNEETEQIQVYLSAPNGHSLAALNLSFHSSKLAINTVDHWRQGIIFKTHWNKQEFINWMKSMIELGQVSNRETYQGAAQPPESLHLHFVPFKQGMLYVGNISPLEKEALELVKALAESFAIAFARYEDFKQLETAKNQIEKTFTELKAAQAQLIQSEKMASLGELTAGIAHEIQNPLNFVNNFSEISNELIDEMKEELAIGNMQLANEIAEDIKQNLKKINHHGKRADAIVKGMLQHSRTSSGQKESTDINALADEYLRLSYHGLRAQDKMFNAEIKTDFDINLPKINVISQEIGRVLLNLINNAFYAVQVVAQNSVSLLQTPQKQQDYNPLVIVSTKNMENYVEIRVKDNGPGIPSEIKDKIFQPFFTTKPTGQGTGLGLSLSYDIVKAHGGEIKVETKEYEGSEFIIQLPIN